MAKRRAAKKNYRTKTPEQREALRARYGNRLVSIYYTETELAGYWFGEIPSVNELTTDIHKTKRRAPTSQVKIFKQSIIDWLQQYRHLAPVFKFFELSIAVWIPVYTSKKSHVVMRDVSNFVKVSEDSICQALGTDDRFHLDVLIHKRNLPKGQDPHWTFVLTGRNNEQHSNEISFKAISFKTQVEEGKGYQVKDPR